MARIFRRNLPVPDLLDKSFFSGISDGEAEDEPGSALPIETSPVYIAQYTREYKRVRSQLSSALGKMLDEVSGAAQRKITQVKTSYRVYSGFKQSTTALLGVMTKNLRTSSATKYRLQKRQSISGKDGSLIRIRNKHCGIEHSQQRLCRSKNTEPEPKPQTEAVMMDFADSMHAVVRNERSYLLRLVEYSSKVVVLTKVGGSLVDSV